MCVLCGELTNGLHWSELEFKEQGRIVTVGSLAGHRMRARLKKLRVLSQVLEFYGLGIKEWQGSQYVLSNAKGSSELVDNLGALWDRAQRLSSKPLDVLDQNLLDFLQSKNA